MALTIGDCLGHDDVTALIGEGGWPPPGPLGFASAFLTDLWGTYIELTEGLNGL